MKYAYAKMTFQMLFISFLALILIGCGESGSPGGASGPGVTASISLSVNSDWEAKVDTGGQQLVEVCEPTPSGGQSCVSQLTSIFESVPSLPADGKSSATIKVELTDSDGKPVMQGTRVRLHTSAGTFLNGKQDYTIKLNESASSFTTSIIAGTLPGKLEITAESNNITQSTIMTFTEEASKAPAFITLGTSATSVKSDNSDSAIITAVILDADRAPVEGVSVSFTTSGDVGSGGAGQISASSLLTDTNGEAQIAFSAGIGDKRNQIVTIEASVAGLDPKQIPIQITGSYLIVTNEGEALLNLGGRSTTLRIAVRDAANAPVYDVPVTLSMAPDSTGSVNFDPPTGKTDINGEFQSVVTGTGLGTVIVSAESIGATGTQVYTVEDPNKEFRIFEPDKDIISLTTNTSQAVRVMATAYQEIVFATSVGTWDGTGKKVVKKQVNNGVAQAVFNSSDAGTATIQVYPTESPGVTDSIRIAISAPSSEASRIFFQTSATVVAPSTSDVKNSVTLIAEVTNAKNQVVIGAPVLFSIVTPTGGGEYVSPTIGFTDSFGIVTSVFTSGSLVAGADGVQVRAELIDKDVFDTASIVISGQAASLTIGHSTEVFTLNEETTYQLPMSVLVTDANGSPVKQKLVSLNLWPSHYRTGYWTPTGINQTFCIPIIEGTRSNEDINKNLILDEGEDTNQDGQLTPPSSAAGNVPMTVVTDDNGIANFYLIYTKMSAAWIVAEMTASTVVSGTETLSTLRMVLPWARSDSEACLLPDSPYFFEEEEPEVGSVTVSTGATAIVADGSSKAVIRAIVNDTQNAPMGGVAVKFTTTLGTFNNSTTATAITSDSGVAVISLQSGDFPGTATVTAEADGFTDQVEVTFTAGGATTLTMTVLPPLVAPGGSASILTLAQDQFGNPVSGALLYFDIYENNTGGSIGTSCSCAQCLTTTATATTDVNGRAIIYYCAGDRLADDWGICTCPGDLIRVTLATNSGVTDETCIGVAVPNGIAGYITLEGADLVLSNAESTDSTTITVKIVDTAGSPMPIDTQIRITTNLGRFANGLREILLYTMDDTGEVQFSLIASGDDLGTATITAVSNGVTQSDNIVIGLGIGQIELSVNPSSIPADGSSTASITATISDILGYPMPSGTEVLFETDLGTFSNGMNSITLATVGTTGAVTSLLLGTTPGTATVSITAGGMSVDIDIEIVEIAAP